jgi:hypothetical protein
MGSLVRLRAIDKLIAERRAELAELNEAQHPHADPASLTPLTPCPERCPIAIRQHAVRAVLKCLWVDRQAALEENARSREASVRRPTITLEMYTAAWEKVKDGKTPRTSLAKELLVTPEGLRKWEKRNLRTD